MSTIQPGNAVASQVNSLAQFAQSSEEDETAQGGESRGTLASDFNTFLTLLTAQMQNQDPLNPADSTEFVAQLAQFSGVEQQIATNETLTSILETLTASGQGSLVDWLGTEVKAAVAAPFSGEPVEVYPEEPEIAATAATLIVSDGDGNIVAEQAFEPGAEAVTWNGTVKGGGTAPPGSYDFSVRYGAASGETEVADAAVFARVTEARRSGADTILILHGGGRVNADEVTGARRPDRQGANTLPVDEGESV